jgi:hypothetical protein
VRAPDGQEVQVRTYIADGDAIDDRLKPYSWYKDFVVKGTQEHGLILEYIQSYGEIQVTDCGRQEAAAGLCRSAESEW